MPETLSPDIRFSWLALADAKTSLTRGPEYFSYYTEAIDADSQEMAPFWWATFQLMRMTDEEIRQITPSLKSGHVVFRPVDRKDVLTRQEDPLIEGDSLPLYILGFAQYKKAEQVNQRLERVIPGYYVVTYDSHDSGLDYGTYEHPVIQLDSKDFNNPKTADDYIAEKTHVVVDTTHFLQCTKDGVYPFGDTPDKALIEYQKLLEAELVEELHVQVQRLVDNDDKRHDKGILQSMLRGSNQEYWLAQMVRMAKASSKNIPIVLEIHQESLKAVGVDSLQHGYKDIVAYLRQI